MIHASVELVEAMKGVAPSPEGHDFDIGLRAACGDSGATSAWVVFGCLMNGVNGGDRRDDGMVVGCPSCLRAMRDAIPAVRWDFLEERGLAPKLPLEDAA